MYGVKNKHGGEVLFIWICVLVMAIIGAVFVIKIRTAHDGLDYYKEKKKKKEWTHPNLPFYASYGNKTKGVNKWKKHKKRQQFYLLQA